MQIYNLIDTQIKKEKNSFNNYNTQMYVIIKKDKINITKQKIKQICV